MTTISDVWVAIKMRERAFDLAVLAPNFRTARIDLENNYVIHKRICAEKYIITCKHDPWTPLSCFIATREEDLRGRPFKDMIVFDHTPYDLKELGQQLLQAYRGNPDNELPFRKT